MRFYRSDKREGDYREFSYTEARLSELNIIHHLPTPSNANRLKLLTFPPDGAQATNRVPHMLHPELLPNVETFTRA